MDSSILEEDCFDEMNSLEKVQSFSLIEIPKSKIQLMHSVFPFHTIISILQQFPDPELKTEINIIIDEINSAKTNSARDRIRNFALKYQPKTINNLIWLYKLGTAEFFLQGSTFDLNVLNLLNDIFKIKINFDKNPLHMHLIAKEILELECLKNSNRNKIYFAKTISTLSQFALYLSVCIIWSVFFSLVKNENKMYRFHKLSELTQIMKNLNINEFKDKENNFYFLLECISYLLNVITAENIRNRIDAFYLDYFKYTKEDIMILKNWCIATNRNFDIKVGDNKFQSDFSLISDLLELDILIVLENLVTNEESMNF